MVSLRGKKRIWQHFKVNREANLTFEMHFSLSPQKYCTRTRKKSSALYVLLTSLAALTVLLMLASSLPLNSTIE